MLFNDTLKEYKFFKIEFSKIVESIVMGGYPSVKNKSQRSQDLWFDSYIEARIEKDLSLIKKVSAENKSEINKLLRILASITSNLLKYSSLSKHLNIKDVTVKSDIEILEALFLVKRVNPYFTNRGKREIKAPKIQFIDTGLASHLIDADPHTLIVSQRETLGNLVENFVYSELLKHGTYANKSTQIYHYRDGSYEVDLVLEQKNGNIVAIEVKSTSIIKEEHLRTVEPILERLSDNYILSFNPNIDEISLADPTLIVEKRNNTRKEYIFDPSKCGLPHVSYQSIAHPGDVGKGADMLLEALQGKKGPVGNILTLNAGVGIYLAGKADSIREGFYRSQDLIESGEAETKINNWRKYQ